MKNRSYSLQRLSSIKGYMNKKQPSRLNFPKPGDSNIYAGVGRKHYHQANIINANQDYLHQQNQRIKQMPFDQNNINDNKKNPSLMAEKINKNSLKNINPIVQERKIFKTVIHEDSLQKMKAEFELKNKPYSHSKGRSQTQQSPLKNSLMLDASKNLAYSNFFNNQQTNSIKLPKIQKMFINPTFLSNINI